MSGEIYLDFNIRDGGEVPPHAPEGLRERGGVHLLLSAGLGDAVQGVRALVQ